MLRRSPAFTLVAIVSLALGIGVNISIFTFINAILLRPLPVPEPGQLVSIYHQSPQVGLSSSSYPDFEFYRGHNDVFSGMLAYLRVPMLLRAGDGSQKLSGELVSQDYFQVLGLRPALGRWFLPGESAVAVMSHGLWQRSFASDPRVLGAQLTIGAGVFTVVGVAPADFRGLVLDWGKPPEVWIPVAAFREAVPAFGEIDVLHQWGMHSFLVAGRLRPGLSIDSAQAQLSVLSARAAPERAQAFRAQWQFTPQVFPAQRARFWPAYRDSIVRVLVMLATAVGMVLLLACFNVANLMLVRATARQKEIAVRLSLGAGRGRLLRQLLTESLLISLLGGAAGLLVAHWTTAYLATFHDPFKIPLSLSTGFDGRVFAFAFVLSAVSGLLFGLAPARQAWRLSLTAGLKSVGAGWGNIVQFTTYLVHSQDIPKFMKYRLREFPKMFSNGAFPPNTLLMIDRLVQEPLLVEVQAVAAL